MNILVLSREQSGYSSRTLRRTLQSRNSVFPKEWPDEPWEQLIGLTLPMHSIANGPDKKSGKVAVVTIQHVIVALREANKSFGHFDQFSSMSEEVLVHLCVPVPLKAVRFLPVTSARVN